MASSAPKLIRYPLGVMMNINASVVRRFVRVAALSPAVLVPMVATPAFADVPVQWEGGEPVSALYALLLLAGVPLLLIAGITLLVYVPSMVRGEKYVPGHAWRNEIEWFGGPRDGLDAVDRSEQDAIESSRSGDAGALEESSRGGARAHW